MKHNKPEETNTAVTQQAAPSPIPDPSSLERYNHVVPGSAERILVMAEKEQQHRHDLEDASARRRSRLAVMAIVFAFICVLSLIGLVVYAIYTGSYGTALATVITAIAAVAGVFGLGKFMKTED